MSSIFSLFKTAENSILSQRQAMDMASQNVANALTPGYKAVSPVLSAKAKDGSFSDMMSSMMTGDDGVDVSLVMGDELGQGSQVAQVHQDQTQGAMVYMPNHPQADADGNVEMSNVDTVKEMMNMLQAVRQYKANLTIVEMAKKAAQEALQMNRNA